MEKDYKKPRRKKKTPKINDFYNGNIIFKTPIFKLKISHFFIILLSFLSNKLPNKLFLLNDKKFSISPISNIKYN